MVENLVPVTAYPCLEPLLGEVLVCQCPPMQSVADSRAKPRNIANLMRVERLIAELTYFAADFLFFLPSHMDLH